MAAWTLLRTLLHHFVGGQECQRSGPFRPQPTDLHASDLFVDNDWSVTCLIDLEWICALRVEMLAVAYWLTGRGVDRLGGDGLVEFDAVHQQFVGILEEVEQEMRGTCCVSEEEVVATLSKMIRQGWDSGAVWFWCCLSEINAMLSVVGDHTTPRFCPESSGEEEVLRQSKIKDRTTNSNHAKHHHCLS